MTLGGRYISLRLKDKWLDQTTNSTTVKIKMVKDEKIRLLVDYKSNKKKPQYLFKFYHSPVDIWDISIYNLDMYYISMSKIKNVPRYIPTPPNPLPKSYLSVSFLAIYLLIEVEDNPSIKFVILLIKEKKILVHWPKAFGGMGWIFPWCEICKWQ